MEILYVGNDQTLEVAGVQDELSGAYYNGATVTATVKTASGVDVAGVSWPITLDYVAASNGNYRGNIDDAAEFAAGKFYIVEITVDAGSGLVAFWRRQVLAQYRTF